MEGVSPVEGQPRIRWIKDAQGIESVLSKRELQVCADTAKQVLTQIHELGESQDHGVIHADFHFENVLFQNGEVHAIDFDDCCFGHYLYDIAVPLEYGVNREAFLRGYKRVHPLPARCDVFLETFVMARSFFMVDYGNADYLRHLVGRFEHFLASA